MFATTATVFATTAPHDSWPHDSWPHPPPPPSPFTSPPPGREGYLARARQFADATQTIVAALKTMPGLRLLCEPDAAIIAFTSDAYDIFSLIDRVHTSGASVPVIICPVPCGSVCCRGFSWQR